MEGGARLKRIRLAVIPGDGIGPEVTDEALKVLAAVSAGTGVDFRTDPFPWGAMYHKTHGRAMPGDALERLADYDAVFLGAVGDPEVPDHLLVRGLVIAIRQGFDQYVNLRPVKLLPGVKSPLALPAGGTVDMVVVRENTEGEYAGAGAWLARGTPREVALQTGVFTRAGTERVMEFAFGLAESRPRRHVTSVSKANALQYAFGLWDEAFRAVAGRHPTVRTRTLLVDAAAMFFVRRPEMFDVVVTSNLFGDILTDLGAAIQGGMGLAAGANLNPERRFPSMFEPIHGSAPDIAGRGVANPLAAIWSAALLCEWLQYPDLARRILDAVEAVTAAGEPLTPDLGGRARTREVGDAVCAALPRPEAPPAAGVGG